MKKSEQLKDISYILLFLALTVASVVFALLSIKGMNYPIIVRFQIPLAVTLSVIIGGLGVSLCVLYLLRKESAYKISFSALICIAVLLAIFYVTVRTGFLEIARDEEKLQEYLRGKGVWMPIVFIVLQFAQVVFLPIPSVVTVAVGTALFGPLLCTLYSLIGIVSGSVLAFVIGRFLGYKAVCWMIGKDTLDKWLEKIKGKDVMLLTAMFLLPMFPDDVLCFVAGLTSMKFVFFVCMIFFSRIISVSTTAFSLELIPFNTWWGLTIWGVLFVLVILLFVFIYKKGDVIQEKIISFFKKK